MDRTARCSCGQLRVDVRGEPDMVAMCTCQECQRRTGSLFSVHAFFPQAGAVIAGRHQAFARGSASGRQVRFHFCPDCASSVFWEAEGRPGAYGIGLGAFAGQALPIPTFAVWTEHKPDWLPLPEGLAAFPQGSAPPPGSVPRSGSRV